MLHQEIDRETLGTAADIDSIRPLNSTSLITPVALYNNPLVTVSYKIHYYMHIDSRKLLSKVAVGPLPTGPLCNCPGHTYGMTDPNCIYCSVPTLYCAVLPNCNGYRGNTRSFYEQINSVTC